MKATSIAQGSQPARSPFGDILPSVGASDRREVLAAVGKLAAFVTPMAIVLLDAEQASARRPCSFDPITAIVEIADSHIDA